MGNRKYARDAAATDIEASQIRVRARRRRQIKVAGQFGALLGVGCGAVFGLLTPALAGIAGILLIYLPRHASFLCLTGLWPFVTLGALEWLIPGMLIGMLVGAVTAVRRDRK